MRVDVTDKSAIYVDDTRITDRSTKWGQHEIIDTFKCERGDVVTECVRRGHLNAVRKIDDDFFLPAGALG